MKKDKIKVAIFIDGEFIPSNSGAANRFHYMSRNLALHQDIEPIIFLGDRGWSDIKLIKNEPFKTYIFNNEDFYQSMDRIIKILKKERIQIIQFDSIEQVLSQGVYIKQQLRVPVILEAHYDFLSFMQNSKLPKNVVLAKRRDIERSKKVIDGLICLSKDEKSKFKEYYKFNTNQICAIPSGVELSEIKNDNINYNSKQCVFLGNLYFRPNEIALDYIYKFIYKKLRDKGYSILIAGDTPLKIKNKYSDSNFNFLGEIDDLNMLFRNSLCALAPIFHGAGMRIKLLNYIGAKLPVLITKEGAEGFPAKKLLKIIDSNKFIDTIEKIQSDKKRWIKNTSKLYDYVSQNLSWISLSSRTAQFYRDTIINNLVKKTKYITVKPSEYLVPSWLYEVKKKGRFKGKKPTVKKGEVLCTGKGCEIIRLKL
jgi:glycosyltransferase involved in cell wall biosynthesis